MKKSYLILLALALCLTGGECFAQDYEWNFTNSTLWNANLITGYYTSTGGSVVSETEPADTKSIYVCSTGTMSLSSGNYYQVKAQSNAAAAPVDDYIKVEIPVGYTVNVTMRRLTTGYSNTCYLLVKDNSASVVASQTTKSTAYVDCSYKNETNTTLIAYVFTVARAASKNSAIQSIKLLETSTVPHAYTVKFTDGTNELQTALTGTCIEKETYTVNIPKVIEKDGAYYVLDDSGNRKDFSQSYTMGTADETQTVTYTKDEAIVFFEDYSGVEKTSASGGSVKDNLGQNQSFTVCADLPAGQYEFSANKFQYGQGRVENFLIDGNTVSGFSKEVGVQTKTFNLSATGTVAVGTGDGTSDYFDYALVRKTGEAITSQDVTIGASGYATYVTPYAMDFTSSSIKAFTVSAIDTENGTVTLEQVSTVPANTAIIVKGSTASVSVCNSAAAVTNSLTYSVTDIEYSEAAASVYYVLAQQDGKVVFAPVTSGTIAAGKGYFTVAQPQTGNAKALALSMPDSTPTVVSEVEAATVSNSPIYYNVAGQRVNADVKGLIILDGKKIFKK